MGAIPKKNFRLRWQPWTMLGFPGLADLRPNLRARLSRESRMTRIAKGIRIFGPGQRPAQFLLVLEGTIRVQQISEGGREIILYRIAAGQSCVLTTACLLSSDDYLAEAIAETAVEAAAIPRATFDELIAQSAPFRWTSAMSKGPSLRPEHAREVISRQLHEFQRCGWMRSGRGAVTITDEAALRGLVKSGGTY